MDVEDLTKTNYSNLILILKNGERVEVDGRFRKLSNLVDTLANANRDQDIPTDQISLDMFNTILDYCKRHNWTPPVVKKPIASNSLQNNLSEQDYLFIKDYPIYKDGRLNDLMGAAYYFQIQSLYDVCICRIATEFYFGNDQHSFDDLKKKLDIKEDLTIEAEEKIRKEYAWI